MVIPVFEGDVTESGRLVLPRREQPRRQQHLMNLAGRRVELVIRPRRRQRSYDQLKYWFGVPMKLLTEVTGYSKLQMHYLCLAICFGVVVDGATGREVPVVAASRVLTTKHFSELIEWCPPWALEVHQVEVPMPNEIDLDSLPGYEDVYQQGAD